MADAPRCREVYISAFDLAFGLIADRTRDGGTIRETRSPVGDHGPFPPHGLTTYSPPIIGVGPHSGDPHYEPVRRQDGVIGHGDFVLIDLWAKLDRPRSVYSDLTRVGFVGETVPARYEDIFTIVARARDAAIACVRDAYAADAPRRLGVCDAAPAGDRRWPDTARISSTGRDITSARKSTATARTWTTSRPTKNGSSCAGLCFSVEPGIYFEFGVRSEINVFVDGGGTVTSPAAFRPRSADPVDRRSQ